MPRRDPIPDDERLEVAIESGGPKIAPTDPFESEDVGDGDVLLTSSIQPGVKIPLFEGVRVVYIGPNPHHAPTLKGHVQIEPLGGKREEAYGDEGQKFITIVGATLVPKASPRNFTNYDFRARDAAGVKSERRMPVNHKLVEVRDRPYQPVRHAEHIYWFMARPQDYHVVVAPESFFAVREYIAARERSSKLRQRFIEATTATTG